MKVTLAALLVTACIVVLGAAAANAASPFGTRSWFSERLNGG